MPLNDFRQVAEGRELADCTPLIRDLMKIASRGKFGLSGVESEMRIDRKQLPPSLIERLAPVAIPVLAILLWVIGTEYFSKSPAIDARLTRVAQRDSTGDSTAPENS